jgi:clan AA aspartic protease
VIRGTVNANTEAIIPLTILDGRGREHVHHAIIDTGFSGFLTLPSATIEMIDLDWRGHATVLLADGATHVVDVYAANIIWDETVRTVEIDAADVEPLVGMGLLRGFALHIDVTDDGAVRIEALS